MPAVEIMFFGLTVRQLILEGEDASCPTPSGSVRVKGYRILQ